MIIDSKDCRPRKIVFFGCQVIKSRSHLVSKSITIFYFQMSYIQDKIENVDKCAHFCFN